MIHYLGGDFKEISYRRQKKKTAKVVTGVMGLCIVAYIDGPSLYWHLNETIGDSLHSSCPPCNDHHHHLLPFVVTDCMRHEDASKESESSLREMVVKELKLRESQAQEDEWRVDRLLLDVKKAASQYQKEADKCSMGMETCELRKQRQLCKEDGK